ncbi:DUF2946 family protein [Bradyrhizobium sp.]|jgi:hypothetical protein|uniref:DUF2946 family protein n=1 Tax=Bradyrhizobium sp. TaxID=376 RepID=UPI003C6B0D13
MLWFRSHIRDGSRLALFALAIQLYVTFGHVHLDGLVGGMVHSATTVQRSGAALHNSNTPVQQAPGKADTDCPICALIQLVSTSAPSVAPPLPTPVMIGGIKLETSLGFRRATFFHLSFQARGPPSI